MITLPLHIDTCLATLGTEKFAPNFCDFVETLGVHQLMVFSIETDHARCLLSRHFKNASLAGHLAQTYLDGWYLKDPLLPELLTASPGTVQLRTLEDTQDQMRADYREIFFDHPGLMAKTTLLAASHRLRLFISLYSEGQDTADRDPDLEQLVGRLALLHFEQRQDTDIPEPLAALSERERAVCLGILSGQKAELIADGLGVAPSTVVTYRKRAYRKLGVTSRAGLFAICKS
jgi:DNA-binding CsgD family transcriptional regulator